MDYMKTLIFIPIILLFSSCYMSREHSQEIMADEAKKQTKLMEEQNAQLKRIADALHGDTTRWHPYIIKSKP